MPDTIQQFIVAEDQAGKRLDVFLAECMDDASRSFIKALIKDGQVTINSNAITKPGRTVQDGDEVVITIPPPPISDLVPEDIPLDVLHEDEHLLIINKQSGLVVHPAPGHYTGTLVHAVLFHCPDFQRPMGELSGFGSDPMRPGIVHRLDQFTSGVMVVGKTQSAFNHLAKQAREHTFDRHYLALVRGEFKEKTGRVNATIGRSLSDRGKMAVTSVKGKEAITHFEVQENFGIASLIKLRLDTGRTHQIRVHMRFAGRQILGDPLYGVTDFAKWQIEPALRHALKALNGQALHAEMLGIEHPATGERMKFTAPPPDDFQLVLEELKKNC
jgi:23S rRNA pseudouridine1911/1915/1917 synthase